MKSKAPNALALLRKDSISSDSGSMISEPDTPGSSLMTEEDYQNCFIEATPENSTSAFGQKFTNIFRLN